MSRAARPPLDPRLVRQVRAARHHVAVSVALGLVQALTAVATAGLVARIGADLLTKDIAPGRQPQLLLAIVAVLAIRAGAVLVQRRTAHRAATAAIAELRGRVVAHTARLGPRAGAGRGADIASLATTGLENLRPYLVGYVPQLVLAATVTPLCLVTIGVLDLTSAVVAAITLPLIPVFMILIGRLTVGRSERLIADMRTLWSQMLDLVDGLPTLRALGREHGPERTVRALGERHRASAMGSLKYAFLSSMVLELLATLGVALVAVEIGLRLVYGHMELFPALAVLVLIPEVYLPLRQVGQQFHASTDGLAAVDAAFTVLAEDALPDGDEPAPDLSRSALRLERVTVRSRDGLAPAGAELEVRPGELTVLTGPSGAGKTTSLEVLLGLLRADEGRAVVVPRDDPAPVEVTAIERRTLWSQVVYLPQRPVIGPGTIRSVLQEAAPEASAEQRSAAAAATGLDRVIAARGEDAPLGRDGSGLSLGERQRLALTRALLVEAPLVVLDEPTAHLDGASEDMIVELVQTLRSRGRTVLAITHRPGLLAIADQVAAIRSRRTTGDGSRENQADGDEANATRRDGVARAGADDRPTQGVRA